MLKMRKLLAVALAVMTLLGSATTSLAASRGDIVEGFGEGETASNTDQVLHALIYEIAGAQNDQDWQKFASYHCAEDKEYFENEINGGSAIEAMEAVFCVRSASVDFIESYDIVKIEGFTSLDYLEDTFGELRAYFVGIDYNVAQEGKSFYNGINYRFFIFGKENGDWKLVACHEAPVDLMADDNRTIMSELEDENSDISKAAMIRQARMEGAIVGSDGTVLEIVSDDYTGAGIREPFGYRGNYTSTSCACTTRPTSVKVYYNSKTQTVARSTYIKDVIPNEWVISSAATASLDAAIVVIQQYATWNTLVYDKYPNYTYDLKASSGDQNYVAGSYNNLSQTYRTKIDTAYLNTQQYYMFNSAGNLFESQYAKGTANSTTGKNGGQLKQLGCDYLATNSSYKYNWQQMCSYYYDSSPKSAKAITFKKY